MADLDQTEKQEEIANPVPDFYSDLDTKPAEDFSEKPEDLPEKNKPFLIATNAESLGLGSWAEETSMGFINLMNIEDGNVRRAALVGMKESDLEILISISQSFIHIQRNYAIEFGVDQVKELAKENQFKLDQMKVWLGI